MTLEQQYIYHSLELRICSYVLFIYKHRGRELAHGQNNNKKKNKGTILYKEAAIDKNEGTNMYVATIYKNYEILVHCGHDLWKQKEWIIPKWLQFT